MTLRDRIVSELTQLDAKKRVSDRHWNRYFLGIALKSLDGFDEDLAAGMSPEEAFADRFTPAREMHGIARRLKLNLDVERGRWVMPDGTLN